MSSNTYEKIAIIGMHGRFPDADNIEQFWENIMHARCSIDSPPDQREELCDYADAWNIEGGFLEEIQKFDANFFNISPNDAKVMDPQQRILLEVTWGALEDAGYTDTSLDRETGVFVGVISGDYGTFLEPLSISGDFPYRGTDRYQLANRLSYFLDISGPSIAIDTACSSSAAAVHLACESLHRHECNVAIVSGVNLFLHPSRLIQYRQLGIISPDNQCLPFGEKANGTVYGEGICSFILKPLSAAENDGDIIHGVILSSAMNAGGRTQGFTVPNRLAQKKVVKKAIKRAGINAKTISYIEAHGTATTVGDPIELRGLKEAFSECISQSDNKQFCALGSVKGNIGHLESTAALASMTKVLKQMQSGKIAPSLHGESTTNIIKFEKTPFYLQKELSDWTKPQIDGKTIPRRAGISSFGAGGANIHILLEEYDNPRCNFDDKDIKSGVKTNHLIILSAQSKPALRLLVTHFSQFLDNFNNSEPAFEQLAYTLQIGRKAWSHRLGIISDGQNDLQNKLNIYLKDKKDSHIISGKTQKDISHVFRPGGDATQVIDGLLTTKAWKPIATLWTKGAHVEWHSLYNHSSKKISLPTYPFDGQKYWLPYTENRKEENVSPLKQIPSSLTTLPGFRVNTPNMDEVNYISNLSLASLPYLIHHQIFQQVIVPGSWYIALALTIIKSEQTNKNKWVLENCTFHETLQLDTSENREISCLLKSSSDKKNSLEIYSRDITTDTQPWTLHFSGLFEKSQASPSDPIVINLQSIRQHCSSVMDVNDFYRMGSQLGFSWSGPFKALNQLQYIEGQAIGQVKNIPLEGDTRTLVVSPALLDACFQVYLTALPANKKHDSEAFIPISIDQIELYDTATSNTCWSVGQLVDSSRNHAVVFNSDITQDSGELLLRFSNFTAYRVNAENLQLQREADKLAYETWYHQPEWKPLNLPPLPEPEAHKPILTIYQSENTLINNLSLAWQRKFDKLQITNIDDNYFEEQLLDWITKENTPTSIALFLQTPSEKSSKEKEFASTQTWCDEIGNILQLLHIVIKSISSGSRPITLWIITQGSQVIGKEPGKPLISGFWGLSRSLAYEYPHLWGGLIDIPDKPNQRDFELLTKIIHSKLQEDQIGVRSGAVSVLRINTIGKNIRSHKSAQISKHAQYVITGGLGSIGQEHAHWLLDKGAGHVVLLGRSAKKDELLQPFKEKYGEKRISYHSVDIANSSELEKCINTLTKRELPIKGVIHTAGTLADGIFESSRWKDFETVLTGKVFGVLNLLKYLVIKDIDFFALTSTATAMLGSPGQSNYTMANACLDSIAHKLNHNGIHAISVNWGPWEGSGMLQDMSEQARRSADLTTGKHGAINREKAAQFFDKLYGINLPQVLILPEGWQHLAPPLTKSRIMSTWKKDDPTTKKLPSTKKNVVSVDSIEGVLRNTINTIQGYGIEIEFDFNQSFQQLGFDSLSSVKLRNQLNEELSLSLPATVIFDYPTPTALVEHIGNQLHDKNHVSSHIKSPTTNSTTDDVTLISEEKAYQLLELELENCSE